MKNNIRRNTFKVVKAHIKMFYDAIIIDDKEVAKNTLLLIDGEINMLIVFGDYKYRKTLYAIRGKIWKDYRNM